MVIISQIYLKPRHTAALMKNKFPVPTNKAIKARPQRGTRKFEKIHIEESIPALLHYHILKLVFFIFTYI